VRAVSAIVERVAAALDAGGLNLLACFAVRDWDAAGPPVELRAEALLPGARSLLVAGSGGRALWRHFTEALAVDPRAAEPHPLDRYVRGVLARAEAILDEAGLAHRRFEPTFAFQPRLDFRRLAALAGLGSPSPIGLIVHPEFGPWWALRAAWLIAAELPATPPCARPCDGCPAPCRAALAPGVEGTIWAATREARLACRLDGARYDDEQLTYHYDPQGRARLLARLGRA
jgi:epoxyqueuosine reductase QueG